MKKLLLISFFVAFINGCASTPTNQKAAPQAPSQYQFSEFKEGEALYKKKKYPLAISKLASFLKKYPKTEVSDNAAFYLAAMHYENGEQKVAVQYWLEIVNSDTASELSDIATLRAAQTLVQIGKTSEALNVVSRFKAQPTTDKATQQQILELSARLKASHGMSFEAAKDFYAASKLVDQQVEKQALINKAGEIIGANLQPEQLEKIVSDPELSLFEPLVRYRLGLIEFERKNWGGARAQFGVLVSKFSGTEYARRGQQYVDLIDARETADGNTIGVILPLSGRYSPAGQKALKAIQMAFGIYGKNSTGVKLAVMDSEGNSEVAQKAIERLVTEDHVAAVIGDITSKTAQAVAQRAQELGVPCVTLSQKQGLTSIGEWVFRVSLTPDIQMRALVDYAILKKNLKKFAILFPNDTYGTEYATAFWDYALSRGAQIVAAQAYAPDEKDFREPIQRLVGTFYEEDRGKELSFRLNDWKKNQTSKSARLKPPKDLLPPIVDFEGIFIPDSPKNAGQIAAMLAYNDVGNVTLLGTNLWNSTQLSSRVGKASENSLFVDEMLSEESNPAFKRFAADHTQLFGYKPDIIEAQAFDAGMVTLSALRASGFSSSRAALRDKLSTLDGVSGASGSLRMNSQREIEKSLIPLTVRQGSVVKSDTDGETSR